LESSFDFLSQNVQFQNIKHAFIVIISISFAFLFGIFCLLQVFGSLDSDSRLKKQHLLTYSMWCTEDIVRA